MSFNTIRLLFFFGLIISPSLSLLQRRITYKSIVHAPKSLSKEAFFQLKEAILPGQVQFLMKLSSNNLHVAVFSCEDKLNPIIRLGPVESIEQFNRELDTSLTKSNRDSGNLASCLNEMNSMIRDIGLQNNDDNLLFIQVYIVKPFPLKELSDFKNSLTNLEEGVSSLNFTFIGNRQERNFNWFEHVFKTINRKIVDFTRIDETKRVIRSLYNSRKKIIKRKRDYYF